MDCNSDATFPSPLGANEANPAPFQAEFPEIMEFSMITVEPGADSIPPS